MKRVAVQNGRLTVNPRTIRRRLGLSVFEFAGRFGLVEDEVRHWEKPGGEIPLSARLLLCVIDSNPDAVEFALRNSQVANPD